MVASILSFHSACTLYSPKLVRKGLTLTMQLDIPGFLYRSLPQLATDFALSNTTLLKNEECVKNL
ncbi:hypothetical protein AMS64_02380 [Aeromonas veronii]|nr:hypothetical protein AMS64_02380 [Aeromonas veronii]POG18242.1 hypothetical protein C2849_15630 [Aeromonas veronii]